MVAHHTAGRFLGELNMLTGQRAYLTARVAEPGRILAIERTEFAARAPLPFETSLPGVFAVGDVRQGSLKRVAAAVGEGSSAVRSVHDYLAASV